MQRPWRGAAYWLAPRGLLSLLSSRIQDHQPRDDTTHRISSPVGTLIISTLQIGETKSLRDLDKRKIKEASSQRRTGLKKVK